MPQQFNFTKASLDALRPLEKRVRYKDLKVDGLIVEVLCSGSKTFRVYKRPKGADRPVNITIGKYPDLSIEQARNAARRHINDLANGINPNQEKRKTKFSQVTLEEAFEKYINSKPFKGVTLRGYFQVFNLYLKSLKSKALNKITEKDCIDLYKDICDGKIIGMRKPSTSQANLTFRLLKAIFNFAIHIYKTDDGQSVITNNPVLVLGNSKMIRDIPRKKSYFDKVSLQRFYSHLIDYRESCIETRYSYGSTVCDYLEVMLLTGLRKTELMTLTWENVDLLKGCMIYKDTKNGLDLELPISKRVRAILEARKKNSSKSKYVFDCDNQLGRISEPKKVVAEIGKLVGIKIQLHDFRRTFCTYAVSAGIGTYLTKRLMNHKVDESDVTAGYLQLNFEQLIEPAQKVESTILSIAQQYGLPK